MWKDRAQAAERRVQVFERFTTKLKGIREAAEVADGQAATEDQQYVGSTRDSGSRTNEYEYDSISAGQDLSTQQGNITMADAMDKVDGHLGHTKDDSITANRNRKCSDRGSDGRNDDTSNSGPYPDGARGCELQEKVG